MLYLVRHGETNWNKEGRVQGIHDVPLNANGKYQALSKRGQFAGHHFTQVFSSPLARAKETAEIITSKAKVDNFTINDDLIEYDFGLRDGLTIEEDSKELEENSRRITPTDYEEEDQDAFMTRISKALIDAAALDGNVMLVSHGAVIATLIRMLLPEEYRDQYFFLDNVSTVCVDNHFDENGNLVITLENLKPSKEELERYLTEND